MFSYHIQPRFSETDALGHVNNTVVPVWFEAARAPVFEIFNAAQDLSKWNLIIAKIEINYLAQISYNADIEIRTFIQKVGRTSFTVFQQGFQNNQCVVSGTCVLVKFDYDTALSIQLSDQEKAQLAAHPVEIE